MVSTVLQGKVHFINTCLLPGVKKKKKMGNPFFLCQLLLVVQVNYSKDVLFGNKLDWCQLC